MSDRYKILIADDEQMIAGGLSEGIDWVSMGFEVAAVYHDGQDVIEHLNRSEVDVILSDVRMTRVGGLEVAEYVSRHFQDTDVVLISGYQEFEYAQRAIALGVVRYIVKPIQLSEVRQVFESIKLRLDQRRAVSNREDRRAREVNELMRAARTQWVEELYFGLAGDAAQITQKAASLYPPNGQARCAIVNVDIHGFEGHVVNHWKHGREMLDTVLVNALEGADKTDYFPMNGSDIRGLYLCVATDPALHWETHFADAAARIRRVFDVGARVEPVQLFSGFVEMAGSAFDAQPAEDAPDAFLICELDALKKLLLTNISLGEREMAGRLIHSMTHKLRSHSWRTQRDAVLRLMRDVRDQLKQEPGQSEFIDGQFIALENAQNPRQLMEAAHALVELAAGAAEGAQPNVQKDLMRRAVEYINAHFDEDLSLNIVADAIYISGNYLCGQFKKSTGLGFHAYLTNLRIQRAMELLKQDDKVSAVGRAVGYPDARHFARVFRTQTGMLPSEYASGIREKKP